MENGCGGGPCRYCGASSHGHRACPARCWKCGNEHSASGCDYRCPGCNLRPTRCNLRPTRCTCGPAHVDDNLVCAVCSERGHHDTKCFYGDQ